MYRILSLPKKVIKLNKWNFSNLCDGPSSPTQVFRWHPVTFHSVLVLFPAWLHPSSCPLAFCLQHSPKIVFTTKFIKLRCKCYVQYGLRGFLRKHEATYDSSSLSVEGLRVSKSISISSGFESRNEGSLDWMMWTTRPSLSPANETHVSNCHWAHTHTLFNQQID